jgi:hypothetical protein
MAAKPIAARAASSAFMRPDMSTPFLTRGFKTNGGTQQVTPFVVKKGSTAMV